MNSSIWPALTGVISVLGAISALYLWSTRRVVREELENLMGRRIEPIEEDIDVLRTAVFNHVAHAEDLPDEDDIRLKLGMEPRATRKRMARLR